MAKKSTVSTPKARIDHSVFGLGTVVEANDHYTTIAFDESGTRKFVTPMVKLSHSDSPAPAKPRRKAATKKTAAKKAATKKTATKKAATKKTSTKTKVAKKSK